MSSRKPARSSPEQEYELSSFPYCSRYQPTEPPRMPGSFSFDLNEQLDTAMQKSRSSATSQMENRNSLYLEGNAQAVAAVSAAATTLQPSAAVDPKLPSTGKARHISTSDKEFIDLAGESAMDDEKYKTKRHARFTTSRQKKSTKEDSQPATVGKTVPTAGLPGMLRSMPATVAVKVTPRDPAQRGSFDSSIVPPPPSGVSSYQPVFPTQVPMISTPSSAECGYGAASDPQNTPGSTVNPSMVYYPSTYYAGSNPGSNPSNPYRTPASVGGYDPYPTQSNNISHSIPAPKSHGSAPHSNEGYYPLYPGYKAYPSAFAVPSSKPQGTSQEAAPVAAKDPYTQPFPADIAKTNADFETVLGQCKASLAALPTSIQPKQSVEGLPTQTAKDIFANLALSAQDEIDAQAATLRSSQSPKTPKGREQASQSDTPSEQADPEVEIPLSYRLYAQTFLRPSGGPEQNSKYVTTEIERPAQPVEEKPVPRATLPQAKPEIRKAPSDTDLHVRRNRGLIDEFPGLVHESSTTRTLMARMERAFSSDMEAYWRGYAPYQRTQEGKSVWLGMPMTEAQALQRLQKTVAKVIKDADQSSEGLPEVPDLVLHFATFKLPAELTSIDPKASRHTQWEKVGEQFVKILALTFGFPDVGEEFGIRGPVDIRSSEEISALCKSKVLARSTIFEPLTVTAKEVRRHLKDYLAESTSKKLADRCAGVQLDEKRDTVSQQKSDSTAEQKSENVPQQKASTVVRTSELETAANVPSKKISQPGSAYRKLVRDVQRDLRERCPRCREPPSAMCEHEVEKLGWVHAGVDVEEELWVRETVVERVVVRGKDLKIEEDGDKNGEDGEDSDWDMV